MAYDINISLLSLFIPTFFVVSATPGMCMTLSLTLGMTIGVRKTLWMMLGELFGVALVSIAAVIGVASIMLNHPVIYLALKYIGGGFLLYLGAQLWRSRGKMAIHDNNVSNIVDVKRSVLVVQGFVTAVANPKGWAFMVSLLPPFIDATLPLKPQLTILILLILILEFCCLLIYANGGKTLGRFLQQRGNVKRMNRFAGLLMMGVGIWLAIG